MFPSYRKVKSGLEISRQRKGVCRTSQIESMLVKILEDKYGNFRDDKTIKDTVSKEKNRRQMHVLSLEQCRLRLLVNKERLTRLQQERLNPFPDPERIQQKENYPPERLSNPADDASKFRKIKLNY